jgi:hypothetical protein
MDHLHEAMKRHVENYHRVDNIKKDRARIRNLMFMDGVRPDRLAVFDEETRVLLMKEKDRFPHPFFNNRGKPNV